MNHSFFRLSILGLLLTVKTAVFAYVLFEVDGLYYKTTSSSTVAVISNNSYKSTFSGNIVIPQVVENNGYSYNVTSIGESAFSSCSKLTSVTFQNNITSIEMNAFKDCSNLEIIDIPQTVSYIDGWAFNGCNKLEKVIIHDISAWCGVRLYKYQSSSGLSLPPHHLYLNNEEIINLVIPGNVNSVSPYTFRNCPYIQSVFLSEGVKTVGDCAFQGCSNLVSLKIGGSTERIEGKTFDGCESLKSIYICDSEKELILGDFSQYGGGLFIDSKLKSVYIGRNLFYSGCNSFGGALLYYEKNSNASPFANQSELNDVTIGEKMTVIPSNLFSGCKSITSITIPPNIEKIGDFSFFQCNNLRNLIIEDSETSLSLGWNFHEYVEVSGVFETCGIDSLYLGRNLEYRTRSGSIGNIYPFERNSLSFVQIGNTVTEIEEGLFANSKLESIELSNNITSIGHEAFSGTYITSIIIPNSVTSIGDFALCSKNLTSVTIGSNVVSIGNGQFCDCDDLRTVISFNPTPPTLRNGIPPFTWKTLYYGTLFVPIGSKASYSSSPDWKDFHNIQELDFSAIIPLEQNNTLSMIKKVYTLKGECVNPSEDYCLPKGIYIKDGKKVVIK